MPIVDVRTESFKLFTNKSILRDARARIATEAALWDVRLDEIEQRSHLISVELVVTVTGPANGIDRMRTALGGNASITSGDLAGDIIAEVLERGTKVLQEARRRRQRRRDLDNPPDTGTY